MKKILLFTAIATAIVFLFSCKTTNSGTDNKNTQLFDRAAINKKYGHDTAMMRVIYGLKWPDTSYVQTFYRCGMSYLEPPAQRTHNDTVVVVMDLLPKSVVERLKNIACGPCKLKTYSGSFQYIDTAIFFRLSRKL